MVRTAKRNGGLESAPFRSDQEIEKPRKTFATRSPNSRARYACRRATTYRFVHRSNFLTTRDFVGLREMEFFEVQPSQSTIRKSCSPIGVSTPCKSDSLHLDQAT
jgi:hypothetical protein